MASTLIVTERDGVVVLYVRDATGELRQRAALDIGIEQTHIELAELGEGLHARYWNANGAAVKAKALAAGEPDAEARRAKDAERKRATYKPRGPLTPELRQQLYGSPHAGPRAKPAEMAERRVKLLAWLADHPHSIASQIGKALRVEVGVARKMAQQLHAAGLVDQIGRGDSSDPFRYSVRPT